MPLGESTRPAAARSEGLDYRRIRFWGSVSFTFSLVTSSAALTLSFAELVLRLVLFVLLVRRLVVGSLAAGSWWRPWARFMRLTAEAATIYGRFLAALSAAW